MMKTKPFRKQEKQKAIKLMFDLLDNIYKAPVEKQSKTLPKKNTQTKLF